MGLVYNTASAQVIQVVKNGCKSRYHSHKDLLGFSKSTTQTTQDPYYLNLNDKVYQLRGKDNRIKGNIYT